MKKVFVVVGVVGPCWETTEENIKAFLDLDRALDLREELEKARPDEDFYVDHVELVS